MVNNFFMDNDFFTIDKIKIYIFIFLILMAIGGYFIFSSSDDVDKVEIKEKPITDMEKLNRVLSIIQPYSNIKFDIDDIYDETEILQNEYLKNGNSRKRIN